MNTEKKEKILFVDDEKSILNISKEYFQHKGYQVFTANNGFEALKVLREIDITCCVTDINMPLMGGLELAEQIREIDNTIPVIIMTGVPSLSNALSTLKNGVVDFLIKPVKLKFLELRVLRVLHERKLLIENILLKKDVEHKARLEKINLELTKKVEELYILNKIMSSITSIDSSSDVFTRMVELTLDIVHADEVAFYALNDTVENPFLIVSSNLSHGKNNIDETTDSCLNISAKNETNIITPVEQLILEIASDKIPLLISKNEGARGLPATIRSFMAVPLNIREKIFGVLIAAINQEGTCFNKKDLYYLSYMAQNAAYAIENLALYENIYENLFSTLYAFVKALEAKDKYTQQHSESVALLSIAIAQEMKCSLEEVETISIAGRLHDIGKIGIPDDILLKPERLTDDEFERVKAHPVIGSDIIGQLGLWDKEQQIIRSHHERYDGNGYPDKLKNNKIPFLARILSVADAFDAMYSDRSYRKKMELGKIIMIITKESGAQFDPDVVNAFLSLYKNNKILDVLNNERMPQTKLD